MVGSQVAEVAGCWRWGVRVTPVLNLLALVLLVVFMVDPPRGKFHFLKALFGADSLFTTWFLPNRFPTTNIFLIGPTVVLMHVFFQANMRMRQRR